MREITITRAVIIALITTLILMGLGFLVAAWKPFVSTKDGWDISIALATIAAAVGTLAAAIIALIVWIKQKEDSRKISNTRAQMAAARLIRALITITNEISHIKTIPADFGSQKFVAKYRLFQEDFYVRYRDDLHALTELDGKIAIKLSYAFGALEGISFQYKILVSNSALLLHEPTGDPVINRGTWLAWVNQAERYLYESIDPMRKLLGEDVFANTL